MTRDELLQRIKHLEAKIGASRTDPLHSHSEGLAVSAPLLKELTALQEQLRRLDAGK